MNQRFLTLCRDHDLLIAGGSDCHGEFVPQRKLGWPAVTMGDLELGEIRDAVVGYGVQT